jgi:AcrR family transcriptional regulator
MATGTKRSPRRYDATRRRAAAEATRARVVASARRLFAERGYGATSIAAIARDASVSVQTVYAAFTSKRGLLFAVLDAADAQAEAASLREALVAAGGDPHRQLRLVVEFCVRFNRQAFDLVEIVRAAGSSDPDLAALRHEGKGRRLQALTGVVHAWAAHGALRHGLSPREAVDVAWTLCGADAYRMLVVHRGWSVERFEAWLFATLAALTFGERPG